MQLDPVQCLIHHDLARKAAGAAGAGGEVEHVFLVVAGGGELVEPLLGDDDVARGAGHLAFAGAFERHAPGLGEFEQALAGGGFGRGAGAIGGDEVDCDQIYRPSCAFAALAISASASASFWGSV